MKSNMAHSISIQSRFRGCLLGLAVGDGLGGRFEGMDRHWIAKRYRTPQQLIENPPTTTLSYTDDTQMMIGVAEALYEDKEIIEKTLCQKFVVNYVPSRGYGRGARRVIEAMEDNKDYHAVACSYFPGGSYGNGAAMRVAPVGLFFLNNLESVSSQAYLSALPTHTHQQGIEGAQILAVAIAIACSMNEWNKSLFYDKLIPHCQSPEFNKQIEKARRITCVEDLIMLGNAITAIESVPTAIASFSLNPHSFTKAVGHVILIGGDTDTIAAMTGALSGAFLGIDAIPQNLLKSIENEGKGRDYIDGLAKNLADMYQST
ncbi:ADP-ribosylglycohydrolase family protein [Candidatus Uabimicrobium sp. HlEnr_7]|uniref:ADP-ribosylglycohydrolase family protein n=1 Tax=Candidatus Uabimicrobium helgolandensis TaxID=3095367 RepID=UPI0035573D7B